MPVRISNLDCVNDRILPRRHRFVWFDCLDRTSRYATATSRALYKAIEELERLQAPRIAREDVASTDAEAAPPSAEAKEEQPEKQGAENALVDTSALAEPEDAVGKAEAA